MGKLPGSSNTDSGPWLGYGDFPEFFNSAQGVSLVDPVRCWILYSLLKQTAVVEGDVWECGVYRGGTAAMLARFLERQRSEKSLRLFDTFSGMPKTDPEKDWHQAGDFADTSLEGVMQLVGCSQRIVYHQGFIPDTFAGLEKSSIAMAHIDVDIRQSVIDCCEFIFPRLSIGGVMVFDDYGVPSW